MLIPDDGINAVLLKKKLVIQFELTKQEVKSTQNFSIQK